MKQNVVPGFALPFPFVVCPPVCLAHVITIGMVKLHHVQQNTLLGLACLFFSSCVDTLALLTTAVRIMRGNYIAKYEHAIAQPTAIMVAQ